MSKVQKQIPYTDTGVIFTCANLLPYTYTQIFKGHKYHKSKFLLFHDLIFTNAVYIISDNILICRTESPSKICTYIVCTVQQSQGVRVGQSTFTEKSHIILLSPVTFRGWWLSNSKELQSEYRIQQLLIYSTEGKPIVTSVYKGVSKHVHHKTKC